MISAALFKFTGNADPQKILDLAPGKMKIRPGFDSMNQEVRSVVGPYPRFFTAGTCTRDGMTRLTVQKWVVMVSGSGLYLL